MASKIEMKLALVLRLQELRTGQDPKLHPSWMDAFERGKVVMVYIEKMKCPVFTPLDTPLSTVLEWADNYKYVKKRSRNKTK